MYVCSLSGPATTPNLKGCKINNAPWASAKSKKCVTFLRGVGVSRRTSIWRFSWTKSICDASLSSVVSAAHMHHRKNWNSMVCKFLLYHGVAKFNGMAFARIYEFARFFCCVEMYYKNSKSILLPTRVYTISILWVFKSFPFIVCDHRARPWGKRGNLGENSVSAWHFVFTSWRRFQRVPLRRRQ